MDGFPTALGHGVGLEIHEEPGLGASGVPLAAGDVIAIEPFCVGRASAASRSRTCCS
jgi:Xaa-Pro aminopeptidase